MPEPAAAPAPAAPAAAAPAPTTSAPAAETLLGTPAPPPSAFKVEDYKLTAPKDSGFDDARLSAHAKWAHEAKLSPEHAQAVLLRDAQAAADEKTQHSAQKAEWLDALKGSMTPDRLHEADVAITALVKQTFGEPVAKWLAETGVIFQPAIFAGFAKLAQQGREGSLVKPTAPSSAGPQMSDGKKQFPKSPLFWSPAERAEAGLS